MGIMSLVELPELESVHRQLARDLHDGVAQTLTTMLIQMENFKSDQHGRTGVIQRLTVFQDTTREALTELRVMLFALRGESALDSIFISRLKSTYGAQFRRRSGTNVRFRVSRSWPAVIPARVAGHVLAIVDEALAYRSPGRSQRAEVHLSVAGEQALLVVRTRGGAESERGAVVVRLRAVRQRVIMLGGTVNIRSKVGELTLTVAFPASQLVAAAESN